MNVAARLRLWLSRKEIQTIKKHLAKAIVGFMGAEILQEIQRLPRWKKDLDATKERMTCKHERFH
jgi:hypothetical protein